MYNISTHDAVVDTTETLENAIWIADTLAVAENVEVTVINTETGSIERVISPIRDRHFGPRERVETPRFAAPPVAGFVPAYQRVKINTVVYRRLDAPGWLVWNLSTDRKVRTRTTAQARAVTNRMRELA